MSEQPSDINFESAFNSVFVNHIHFPVNYNVNLAPIDSLGHFEFNSTNTTISYQNNNNFITIKMREENNKGGKIIHFITKKKRGRNSSNKSGKYHSGIDNDNIETKIQVHFLNFIVDFFNDIIYDQYGIENYFLKFDYSIKKKVNSTYLHNLMKKTIRQIIETFKISRKYKIKKDECEINKKKLLLLNKNDLIENCLDMNYLDFFLIYFNNNKPLKEYIKNGMVVPLSLKTKSFFYLIKKYKKDEQFFNRIIKTDYLDKVDLVSEINFDISDGN